MDALQVVETYLKKNWIAESALKLMVAIAFFVIFKFLLNLSHQFGQWRRLRSSLNFLPGPPSLPVLGNLLQLSMMSNYRDGVLNLMDKYGPIFRFHLFHQSFVIISSLSIAQQLLKSTKLGHTFKAVVPVTTYGTKGMLMINGPEWRTQRKMLIPTMSKPCIENYVKCANNYCKLLVKYLETLNNAGQPHSANSIVTGHIVALSCEMITGVPLTNMDECIQHHHDFEKYGVITQTLLGKPWLTLPLVNKIHPIYKERAGALKNLNEFVNRRLAEIYAKRKFAESENKVETMERGMLDAFIDNNLAKEVVVDQFKNVLVGAYETVGSTMHFVLWTLALHQEHQDLCRKEVDEVFDELTGPKDELNVEAVNKMKHLDMCISEALRMYPVAYSLIRHIAEPLKIEYKGEEKELPKGVFVNVNILGIHKDNPNPDKFDPSRFSPESIAQHGPPSSIPFSLGIRNCIGLPFSMVELKVITAHILRNFIWTTEDKVTDVKIKCSFNLMPERDINFKFLRRSHLQS